MLRFTFSRLAALFTASLLYSPLPASAQSPASQMPAPVTKPFTFATTPGQLPRVARPVSYAIRIAPDIKTMTTHGSETVTVNVLNPTRALTLNALNMTVLGARLVNGKTSTPAVVTQNAKGETATLTFPRVLAKGPQTIAIQFAGKIIEQSAGLYYAKYQSPTGPKVMLGTQMEPTDARRFFPCWDEPVYRASYQLTVQVPQKWMAVSNMPVQKEKPGGAGMKTVAFLPTPPMASYLVAFVAGELEAVKGTADGIPVRVVTTQGKGPQAQYALSVIEKLLPFYDTYFGVKFPLPKMDLIAVPGGFDGAMENWGCIVYNEGVLLWNPKTASQGDKEQVFHVIAHETAHQWFGDLVTMAWWDDLWLNEGFASWMDLKATDHFNPDWQVWLRSAADRRQAMGADARITTHPIEQPIATPAQAEQAFDNITYLKGQSVIRMVETYLGADTFRQGIRAYMAAHKYSSATTADLWAALSAASGKDIAPVAGSFTSQPGFPLVTASLAADGTSLTLAQQRFFVDGTPPGDTLWQVPVALSSDTSVPTMTVLTGRSATLPSNALIVNAGGVGYYRVNYTGALWDTVQKAAPSLSPDDQVTLLGDRWALAQAGTVSAADYLALADALHGSTNLAVWQQIGATLGNLDNLERGEPGRPALQGLMRARLHPLLATLGYEARSGEDDNTVLLRTLLIGALAGLDDPDTKAWAQAKFAAFVQNPASLPGSQRDLVLGTVGRYADQATYDQLLKLARTATDYTDKQAFYGALSGALDPKLASQTMALSLTDELPGAAGVFLLFGVGFGGEHLDMVKDFVLAHNSALSAKMDAITGITLVPTVFQGFTDNAHADELQAWAKAHLPPDAAPLVARSVNAIRTNAAIKQRMVPQVDTWVAAHAAASAQGG